MFRNVTLLAKRIVILYRLTGPLEFAKFARLYASGRRILKLHLRHVLYPIYIRKGFSEDIWVIIQIFWRNELNVVLTGQPEYIVDAGAHIGLASVYFANRFPHARIVAIEPADQNIRMFRLNCSQYKNIELLEGAIWHTSGWVRISDSNVSSWEFSVENTSSDDPNKIAALTIDDVARRMNMPIIDLLKLDIEGAEREIFIPSAGPWLNHTEVAMVELHDRYVQGCRKQVQQTADENYFEVEEMDHSEYLVLRKMHASLPANKDTAEASNVTASGISS